MRNKIYIIMRKLYGYTMTVAFFGGLIPLFPFIYAIIVGGETGEAISLFLKEKIYPVIIALASIAVLIGLISMYIGGKQGLSVKTISNDDASKDNGAN